MAKIEVKELSPNLVHARGGEVVLYKRGDSTRWQARFKLKDLKWHRVATKYQNTQYAAQAACEAYDRARFLLEENIPVSSKRFDVVANLAVEEMTKQLASGVGKSVYKDYITAIRKYLVPFFGHKFMNSIGYEELKLFGEWRIKEMKRKPVASTVTTHTSALNRVFDCAVERGWLAHSQVPKIKNTGAKGTVREALTKSEYKQLTSYMPAWCLRGRTPKTVEMRELLRDYILILVNTGIRHGTEAMSLKWRDINYHSANGERYLELTVNGKVGKRTLIANHNTEIYLKRLQMRQPELAKLSFEALLKRRVNEPVFKLASGETTRNLIGTFRNLMRDSGIDKDRLAKEKRSLYSLRHTYAHFELLRGRVDVYTLATQMGTSVKMIEQHYGHMKPRMQAEMIAGKRHVAKKAESAAVAEKPKLERVK